MITTPSIMDDEFNPHGYWENPNMSEMECVVQFRSAVFHNHVVNSQLNHELNDYFSSLFNMEFNPEVNLNLTPGSRILHYISRCRQRLDAKLGSELMNHLDDVFNQEVESWVLGVNERVAAGEDFMELVVRESPMVGQCISRKVDEVLSRSRL